MERVSDIDFAALCSGNLHGLTSKVDYLKRMTVTALWPSPICKQVPFLSTYHGYDIQDFLSDDPHFRTSNYRIPPTERELLSSYFFP